MLAPYTRFELSEMGVTEEAAAENINRALFHSLEVVRSLVRKVKSDKPFGADN